MKLNIDCMREVLLKTELQPYDTNLPIENLYNMLTCYSHDEIDYSCLKLQEAGYLEINVIEFDGGYFIHDVEDITYIGHQFLENVRGDKVWKTTKTVASKVGSYSLTAITQIAAGVISAIIRQELGFM